MLEYRQALAALAEKLGPPADAPDAGGARVFGLTENMRLGVEGLPGGAGLLAWSEAGAADGADAEEKAARLMRLRLARLRGAPDIEATREGGRLLLFWRGRPETVREWMDAVAALLNETEAMRRLAPADAAGGFPVPGPLAGLARPFTPGTGLSGR